jgi:hypothetical protein
LPDGFEDLTRYNLICFKSHREKLSEWTLCELVAHYVNLRKQVSPSMDERDLLPVEDFRLDAVSVRFPQELVSKVPLTPIKPGVYEVPFFTRRIRLIVANQLPPAQHNVLLNVFSIKPELLSYGVEHYKVRSDETTTLLYDLLVKFRSEEPAMPDALEEFTRQTIDRLLKELPAEKKLESVSIKDRLKGVPPEDRVQGMSSEERLQGESSEDFRNSLPVEKREEFLRLLADRVKKSN